MRMSTIATLLLTSALILALTACSGAPSELVESLSAVQPTTEPKVMFGTVVSTEPDPEPTLTPLVVKYDSDDLGGASSGGSETSYIKLDGGSISVDGSGATVDGSLVTITSSGTYDISGTLDDGQIIVDTKDEETVVLVLSGAEIASSTSAPIYVLNADKTVITLADGADNSVTDARNEVLESEETDEPNAAIFSKDDLTVNGAGSLTVRANYNHGIVSKDDLKITGGSITVYAAKDGIKGRDSIAVKDGRIAIQAGGDGMQANNDEDADEGTIVIEGGTLDITAGLDGIQAATRLEIGGGAITISSGGGSGSYGPEQSAKGLKAGVDVTITSGTFDIDASDDAIHSNDSLTINGGEMHLATRDDGIHSDATLVINGGVLDVVQSYEGIESAIITINDGTIHLKSSDDGINVVGDNDGAFGDGAPMNRRVRPDEFATGNRYLYINGGTIAIDADGDGLDINGSVQMTQGTLIVHGPTGNMNGALDYNGTFTMTGGFLVAGGSAGMAQAPDTSSTQYVVMHTFASPQAGGTLVHLESQSGENILTFAPNKTYQSVVFSSPELENGATYLVFSGGNSTGTVTDGLYSGGTYTAGHQETSLTLSSIVTGGDPRGGGFRGGPPGGGRTRPGGR